MFSPHISDLLVRCCVQIEALSKELYFDNGGTKPRGDTSILFDEDCLKLIDIKWQTHNKEVLIVAPFFNFTKDENRILKPLKEALTRDKEHIGKELIKLLNTIGIPLYKRAILKLLFTL